LSPEFIERKQQATFDKVLDEARSGSKCSLDYLAYCCVASLISAIELLTDNPTFIVASMLVSPLMSPIIGCILGSSTRNSVLALVSSRTEIIGLVICIAMGVLVGFLYSVTSDVVQLSQEMLARGTLRGLIFGGLLAIPSGIGASLAVLGQKTDGLIGVAI
jgi:uncharacterized membrane protein